MVEHRLPERLGQVVAAHAAEPGLHLGPDGEMGGVPFPVHLGGEGHDLSQHGQGFFVGHLPEQGLAQPPPGFEQIIDPHAADPEQQAAGLHVIRLLPDLNQGQGLFENAQPLLRAPLFQHGGRQALPHHHLGDRHVGHPGEDLEHPAEGPLPTNSECCFSAPFSL